MAFTDIQPGFPVAIDVTYETLKSDWRTGALFTRSRHARASRIFTVHYKILTEAEKDTIEWVFNGVKGGGAAGWQPPTEASPIQVRFLDDKLVWRKHSHTKYSTTLRLEEILLPVQPT